MRQLFLIIVIILSIGNVNQAHSSEDSLLSLKGNSKLTYFLTLSDDGKSLNRWQSYTGRFLTTYEVEGSHLLEFFMDEDNSSVIGVNFSGITLWDLYTGELKSRIPWPGDISEMLADNYSIISNKDIFSYEPNSNRIALCNAKELIVLDLNSSEIIYKEFQKYIVRQPVFLDNGNTLVVYESISDEVFSIDLSNGKRKVVMTGLSYLHIVGRSDGKRLVVLNGIEWTAFDQNLNKIGSGSIPYGIYSSSQCSFFGLTDFFVDVNGTVINYYSISSPEFTASRYLDENITTSFTGLNKILFSDGKYEYLSDIFGNDLAMTSVLTAAPNVDQLDTPYDSILRFNGVNLQHASPVTVFSKLDDGITTGDINGNVYMWDNEGNKRGEKAVFGDPISFIGNESPSKVYVGSMGRTVEFFKDSLTFGHVIRGHKRMITEVGISENRQTIFTVGQDKRALFWDNQTNNLIKEINVDELITTATLSKDSFDYQTINKGSHSLQSNFLQEYYNPKRELLLNSKHSSTINSMEFSPDGNTLMTCDYDGVVKIWDVTNMVAINTIINNPSASHAVFSIDGNQVINFTNRELYINDSRTGELIKSSEIPALFSNVYIHMLEIAGNGNVVFIDNNNSREQLFWILNSDKFYYFNYSEHEYAPYGICLSPDEKELLTVSADGVHFYDVNNGKLLRQISYPNDTYKNMYVIREIEYSPDGELIAVEYDDEITIYNARSLNLVRSIQDAFYFTWVDNQELVYVNRNNVSRIDVVSGKEIFYINSYDGNRNLAEVVYDPNQNILAFRTTQNLIEILDADNGRILKRSNSRSNRKIYGGFVGSGDVVAINVPGGIQVMDWKNAEQLKYIRIPWIRSTSFFDLEVSNNGDYMIAYNSYKSAVYNSSFEKLYELPGSYGMKISPDSKWIGSKEGLGGTLKIYNLENGTLHFQKDQDDKKGYISDYVFSPEGDGFVCIYNEYKSKKEQANLGRFENKVNFIFQGYDLINNQKAFKDVEMNYDNAQYLSLSRDGRFLAFKSAFRTIQIIDNTNPATSGQITLDDAFDFISFSEDSQYLIVGYENGAMAFYNPESKLKERTYQGHNASVETISFRDETMISFSSDATAIVWDTSKDNEVVKMSTFDSDNYIFMNSDNYYTGTKDVASSVFFKQGQDVFPFEQYDLIYNRPDLIVSSLGAEKERVDAYFEAYRKRLVNMGFDPALIQDVQTDLPKIETIYATNELRTTESSIDLKVKAWDENYMIDRINIWVNDVPEYGYLGFSVAEEATSQVSNSFSLKLSSGKNKIQVSCHNSKGIESLRETFEIVYTPSSEQKPDLYIVTLSVSDYQDDNYDLRFAAKDGEDLISLLGKDRGAFENVYFDTLFNQNVTLENFASIKSRLMESNVDDHVIVFVSGHGLLDSNYDFYFASYDMNFSDPALRGISYEEIEGLLDGIPARKKLLMMDACHSGEVDREGLVTAETDNELPDVSSGWGGKGAVGESETSGLGLSNSFELMQELFANLSRGSGAIVISAAAGDSYALEKDELKNGVFTYCVRQALGDNPEGIAYGDSNKDGQVTVSELKDYVFREVENLTNGLQKPTSRRENLEFDFVVK